MTLGRPANYVSLLGLAALGGPALPVPELACRQRICHGVTVEHPDYAYNWLAHYIPEVTWDRPHHSQIIYWQRSGP